MTDRRPSYGLLAGRNSDRGPEEPLDVLYVDSDAGVREATRRAIHDQWDSISIASVADVDSALAVRTDRIDCLVLDPVGLDGAVELYSRLDCPVILYTERDPVDIDETLLADAATIVEKSPGTIPAELLAEKIVGVSATQGDKREYALNEALTDIEQRAERDETTLLVDDEGAIVWSSAALDGRVPGVERDPETVTELVESLVPDATTGQETCERLAAGPSEPVTVRGVEPDRHVLWRESRLPEVAGSLRLIQLREVTESANHLARETLLELLVEFAQDGLYTLDANGDIDFCNEAFAEMLGYEPGELRGEHASSVLAPNEFSKGQETVQQLVATPEVSETTVDLTFVRNDGTERELSVHYSLLEGPDESYQGMIGVARDVTERAERKQELVRYEELFNNLVANFPNGGVFLFDDDLRYVEAGGQDFEEVGLERSDFIGKTPREIFPAENAAKLEAAYQDALEGGNQSFEDSFGGLDYKVLVIPIRTEAGDAAAGLAVAQNITDMTERERELRETTERLELALEGSDLGVWDWNVETGEVNFDERWTGMLGYDHSEVAQQLKTWEDLVHPDDIDRAWDTIQRHFDGETDIYECDHRLRAKSGEYRWIRDLGRVFERDEDGEPQRMVGIHQDITERKERQQELEAQRDDLKTLTQIYVLIQDIIRALSSAVTSADIEEMVCHRLVESEFYEVAWVGERSVMKNHLTWKTGAGGGEAYHDIVAERSREVFREDDPGMTAVETGEVQLIHDVANDERMAHWREEALARDLRSAAVVPLVHDDIVHSALIVYANRPEAFSDRAIEAFTILGEMIGFAFTAVQNRHLLMRDRIVELEFQSSDPTVWPVAVATSHDCTLELSGCVDIGERFLDYVTVTGADPEAVLESCLERSAVTDGRVVAVDDDGTAGRLELTVTRGYQPLMLDVGAQPIEIVADGDGIEITAQAPLDADPRTIHQTLADDIPGLKLTSKRQRTRDAEADQPDEDVFDQLTTRQEEVLQAAYLAGYFSWPRDTTAEELAESLGISSPTLHQHLRRATLNLLEAVLDS